MLTAGELRAIKCGVAALRLAMRLERKDSASGTLRFFEVDAVCDGTTWLVKITSEKGVVFAGTADGKDIEKGFCETIGKLKRDLEQETKPS